MNSLWRLSELLASRRRDSLSIEPWPDLKKCVVLKPFVHRGQQVHSRDSFKHIDADVIELEPAEAKGLQKEGLVSALPAADRLKCGPPKVTGWRPWNQSWNAPAYDWNGRGGLDGFDDCLVRIAYLGFGGVQLCPGLIFTAADNPIYFPFGWLRVSASGYHCEDDPHPVGVFRVYLDEFGPIPATKPPMETR
jgi:hypothetical protein